MSGLVEVETFGTPVEADLARLYLENEGVDAFLFDIGVNSVAGGWMLVPIRLMVLDEDLAKARRLLKDYRP